MFSLWVGQKTSVSVLNVADDGVKEPANMGPPDQWGDGTSTRIYKGWGAVGRRYTRAARYPISLTLTDPAGHSTVLKTVGPLVSVPAAKYKLSAYSVWPGQVFSMTISKVPAGTTKITVDEGDGYAVTLPGKNQAIKVYYYHRKNGGLIKGRVTLRATFYNKFGASSAVYVGVVNVKTDSWKPVVKVKKPKNPTKIKSWKTVTGTVSDKGSGAPYVYVWVTRINGSAVYCYTPAKKWKRVYSEEQYNNCRPGRHHSFQGQVVAEDQRPGQGHGLRRRSRVGLGRQRASKWASIQSKVKITK